MTKSVRIDNVEYDMEQLSQAGRDLYERLSFTQSRLQEYNNMLALLMKAKNAYIADLKTEIVKGRTGVDLGALF
jgi:glutamyl/glutaminyl-tRNA synthetase